TANATSTRAPTMRCLSPLSSIAIPNPLIEPAGPANPGPRPRRKTIRTTVSRHPRRPVHTALQAQHARPCIAPLQPPGLAGTRPARQQNVNAAYPVVPPPSRKPDSGAVRQPRANPYRPTARTPPSVFRGAGDFPGAAPDNRLHGDYAQHRATV